MKFQDYYKTLGVDKSASESEVQKAYRKLARKFHPDINKDPEAEVRFKEINEAYEVLKDPEKRKKYDQFGSAWKQAQRTGGPPPGFEGVRFDFGDGSDFGASGFSSFFESLFGGGSPFGGGGFSGSPFEGGRRGQGGARRRPRSGQDLESKVRLGLEQAAHGGKHKLTVSDPLSGSQRDLTVTIPAGILPGQKIRLSGQGGEGFGGAERGDLFLTVEIGPDSHFRLEGRDLHATLPITPWEAALGTEAAIRTLDGPITVRIPPGSSTGRKIRLRGKGYPARAGTGDLYVELKVVVPTEMSTRERELFEELAAVSTFQAREEPVPAKG